MWDKFDANPSVGGKKWLLAEARFCKKTNQDRKTGKPERVWGKRK